MTQYHSSAVVIGGAQNALGVIRGLGRMGINAYCLIQDASQFAQYSRYCQSYAVVPNIEQDPTILKRYLHAFQRRFRETLYVHPTSDLSVLTLSHVINDLDGYVASIPPYNTVEILTRKRLFYTSLQNRGIAHPLTLYSNETNVNDALTPDAYPVYVKPSVAQVFQSRFGLKGFVAHTEQELLHYLQVAEHAQIDVMVQEIIPGRITDEYVVRGFIDRTGVLRVLQTVQKLRKHHPFTVATAYKSVPPSEVSGFHDEVTDYLISLQYRGIFVAEIKRDSRDRDFKLLEVNARSGGGNAHLQACGVNHIFLAYCDALQLPVSGNLEPKINVYSTDSVRDVISLWRMVINGTLDFKDVVSSYLFGVDWLYAREDIVPVMKHLQTLFEGYVHAR